MQRWICDNCGADGWREDLPGQPSVVHLSFCDECFPRPVYRPMTQPINTEDIPEIVYPRYLMATEPPADQYELKIEVDQWAAEQAIDDTDLKPHGLAWLALSELARIEHCENYYGAVQDRHLP